MEHAVIVILMGVAGSGKTTVGRKLAETLGCSFYDADDFHTPSNKDKMSRGIPLSDEDRRPWLETLRAEIKKWASEKGPAVLACSALKQKYRDLLSKGLPVLWVYLRGDRETLLRRLEGRKGHYAGPSLLDSQLESLEEPSDALIVDIQKEPDEIVRQILRFLSLADN